MGLWHLTSRYIGLGKSWQEDVGMCKEVKAHSLAMLPNFGKVGLGINQNKPVKRGVLNFLTFEECMDWSPTYDLLKFCTKIRIARSSLCLLNS